MKWILNIFCKTNRKFFIDAIIIIIPILLIYLFLNQKTPETRDTTEENKKINAKIDSVKIYNEFISEKILQIEANQQAFNDIIIINNALIEENNKELLKLKRNYNAKINNANSFNVSQLDSFFTARYKAQYGR
jgi:regulatory protein YycI of two-component signal transduction system YycFG